MWIVRDGCRHARRRRRAAGAHHRGIAAGVFLWIGPPLAISARAGHCSLAAAALPPSPCHHRRTITARPLPPKHGCAGPANPQLQQKTAYRSNTCTAPLGSGCGLTMGFELWITASGTGHHPRMPGQER